MDKKYHITTETDHHRIIQFLEDRLYEHNAGKVHTDDGNLFSIVARSENNDIIAGIAGWTWTGACEIAQLWVAEAFQDQGIGLQLLLAAEAQAQSKGCSIILVRSYSFQAPAFYEKHGYRTQHIIDEFPPGHCYHILTKKIA